MEMNSNLEDDDGHRTDALCLYNDAVFKGTQHRCLMNADLRQAADMVARSDKWRNRPLQSVYSNPQKEFKNWGWEYSRTSLWTDSSDKLMSSEFDRYGLVNLMGSLRLSTDVKHWYAAKVGQGKDWNMNGKQGRALLIQGRPLFYYQVATNGLHSDSSARTVILPFMLSPSVRRIKEWPDFPTGTLPSDLKSCSDLVHLMYYLFAKKIDITIDSSGGPGVRISAPKYFIIPGIDTAEVVAVSKHIFQQSNLGYVDPPGKKWAADSEEGKALIGTLHGAAISFFLLQHKQQFGVKVITSISVWHIKWTVEDSQTWHMWVEIGDPHPVSTDSFPDEHADKGQAVAKGGDLICMMSMTLESAQEWASKATKWAGLTVQSQFYDPKDMQKWGWVDSPPEDDFDAYELTIEYFEGLGLGPVDEETWQTVKWEHKKAWAVAGKAGPAIDEAQYITYFNMDKTQSVFIVQMMYSPSYQVTIKKKPGPAPALSKPSDLWFLQWYAHGLLHLDFAPVASKSRIPVPQHIYIQNIVTEEVQELLGKLVDDEDEDAATKKPGGLHLGPDDENGRMVLGTRHGAAVCMFLIQHKEQFGEKTVIGIRVLQDDMDRWFVDVDIGDVEEDDVDVMEIGKRELIKAKL